MVMKKSNSVTVPPKVAKHKPTCIVSKPPPNTKVCESNSQECDQKDTEIAETVQVAKEVTLNININVKH